MPKVLVVYYSRTGNTEEMAREVAEALKQVEGVEVEVKRVDYATIYDLVECDGVVFGSPNYFGYMAGKLKDFFERALSVREKVSGKPAAAFTSGGSPSKSALESLEKLIEAFQLQKVFEGIACQAPISAKDREACKKMGLAVGQAAEQ